MKRRSIALAIAATAFVASAVPAQAAVTPQQGIADLFTVALWNQPAAQEQRVCKLLAKNPTRATRIVQKSVGSWAKLQQELGLTGAQLLAAGLQGIRNGCSSSPNPVVAQDAVAGLVSAILQSRPAAERAAVCSAFAANQSATVTQFAGSFTNLPIPASAVTSGVTAALQQTCTSS